MAKVRTNNGGTTPAKVAPKPVEYRRTVPDEDKAAYRSEISGDKPAPKFGAKGYEEELARRTDKLKEINAREGEKNATIVEAKKREMEEKRRAEGKGNSVVDSLTNKETHDKVRTGEPGTYGTPKKKVIYKKPTM